jgi:hypothetical protein
MPVNLQYTKSPRIELDYDVRDAGPSGVARVELWRTTDNGRTWTEHGTDKDMTTPFPVELTEDGIYGFRLLIHNQQGQSAPAPQSGEAADLSICLDRKPPQVKWLGSEIIREGERPVLVVAWDATDEHLSETPVRITYAPTASGPWAPLADGLSNSGSHRIPVDPSMPATVFLRVEVTDLASNASFAQPTQSIGLDTKRPQGVIRGFRPVTRLPATEPTPR